MNVGPLLAAGGDEGFVATAAADVDAEALDFLVERGERDHEALGGFGLVPIGALEHIDNDAALDFVHDLEERRLAAVGSGARAGLAGQGRQEFRKLQAYAADDFLGADALREQVDGDALLRGKNDGALDDIFEFADVARPIVVHQELEGRGSEMAQGLGIFLAVAVEEMHQQRGNVFAAVAQLRQLQVNDVEAVVEIFAEAALADEGEQVDIG